MDVFLIEAQRPDRKSVHGVRLMKNQPGSDRRFLRVEIKSLIEARKQLAIYQSARDPDFYESIDLEAARDRIIARAESLPVILFWIIATGTAATGAVYGLDSLWSRFIG